MPLIVLMFMSVKPEQWDGLKPEGNSELPLFASLLTFFNNFFTFGKKWTDVAWESLSAF